jgi:hypothetical protein
VIRTNIWAALRKRGDDLERNEKEEEEEELLERGEEEINKEESFMIPNWSPEEGRQYNGQMKKDNKTKNVI